MIRVVIREPGAGELRFVYNKRVLSIGRMPENDVVLAGRDISHRHARVRIDDGELVVVDLDSRHGTFVNNVRVTAPTRFAADDRIGVGDTTLQFVPDAEDVDTCEVDATELRLLVAVAQSEPGGREVYADWLDERGEAARAEFLRVQEVVLQARLAQPALYLARDRLRVLATGIDLRWRMRVARPVVEGCRASGGPCARDWSALAATPRPDVRRCPGCDQNVYYCATLREARDHTERGARVAVDPAAARYGDDLWHDPEAGSIYVETDATVPR